MERTVALAGDVIDRCRSLAECTEEPGFITRTFLSRPAREVHERLRGWMEKTGMTVHTDAAGNLRGVYPAAHPAAPRLFIGSHLDTVPRAGAYDGMLGVVLPISLVEMLDRRRLKFHIEIVGFSEEEGVRFGVPFIGSRALVGAVDDELLARRDAAGVSVREAIAAFGLDPLRLDDACAGADALAYFEFHIEQGPVLDSLALQLGAVTAIVGQSRLDLLFEGQTNHAGTTPMNMRRDALAGAAEWIGTVERAASGVPGLVATTGRLQARPGADNVIPGSVTVSLDIRHADDVVRAQALESLLAAAAQIAARRSLSVSWKQRLDQSGTAMDASMVQLLERAIITAGYPVRRLTSGAGHDAMIIAQRMPAAMLFLRSPGGISHHPDESVLHEDVAAALAVGLRFLENVEAGLA